MSGSALSPWAIARDSVKYTRQVAKELDCPVEDNRALIECFKNRYVKSYNPLIQNNHESFSPNKQIRFSILIPLVFCKFNPKPTLVHVRSSNVQRRMIEEIYLIQYLIDFFVKK